MREVDAALAGPLAARPRGKRCACRAPRALNSYGRSCLRSAISISMPGSVVAAEDLDDARDRLAMLASAARRSRRRRPGPACALPRSSGGISRSWLIRRFSATTNQMPRSSWMRPTTSRLARASTSTISPSGRPRRSTPDPRRGHAIAVQHLVHLARRQEQIVAAVVGNEKSETVGMALHRAGHEVELGDDAELALAIDEQLAVALERRHAGIEHVLLLAPEPQAGCNLDGRQRDARFGQLTQDCVTRRRRTARRTRRRGCIVRRGRRTPAQGNGSGQGSGLPSSDDIADGRRRGARTDMRILKPGAAAAGFHALAATLTRRGWRSHRSLHHAGTFASNTHRWRPVTGSSAMTRPSGVLRYSVPST